MKKKRLEAVLILSLIAAMLAGCGGSNGNLADLSGTYVCDTIQFDIGSLTFSSGGKVGLSMDWEYTGSYKKSVGQYVLSITGGKSSVSELLAKEKNKAYKITAEPNDDGSLTVFIKAKSGYMYLGKESAIFKKK